MNSKKCPSCHSIYTDETLNFCLTDGTLLVYEKSTVNTQELTQRKTENFSNKDLSKSKENPEIKTKERITSAINSQQSNGNNQFVFKVLASMFILVLTIICVFFGLSYFENKNTVLTEIPNQNINSNSKIEKPTKNPNSYRVIGVPANDNLIIRSEAGINNKKIGSIPPNAKEIIYKGESKKVKTSVWFLIEYKGNVGWVNSRYLSKK